MEKSRGIIIRLTKLTETSLIVHWCTENDGLIKTVAKGARRPKSAFFGKLDLFFESELVWVRSRKSELHILREVAVADYRENLRKRYVDMVTASYFSELLVYVVELDYPIPELFDLLHRGLNYLAKEGSDRRALLHYERELVRMLGVAQDNVDSSVALEQAFGGVPRGRTTCLEMMKK